MRAKAIGAIVVLFGFLGTQLNIPTAAPEGNVSSGRITADSAEHAFAVQELVLANHILAQKGIVDAYGHVSIRHPTNPHRYLMSRSVAPAQVTADDILEYDLASVPVVANAPTGVLERFIHGEIYRARPDVRAIVHSHSPAAIPFGVTGVALRPVFHMAAFLYVGVPVWDIRSSADAAAAGMLVRNQALGASLAKTLGDKPAALLRGHGAVVAARDVRNAVRNAIYLELNARLQAEAVRLGGPITYISPEEGAAIAKSKGDLERAWELWRREALAK